MKHEQNKWNLNEMNLFGVFLCKLSEIGMSLVPIFIFSMDPILNEHSRFDNMKKYMNYHVLFWTESGIKNSMNTLE
jgi:hypothetical protein